MCPSPGRSQTGRTASAGGRTGRGSSNASVTKAKWVRKGAMGEEAPGDSEGLDPTKLSMSGEGLESL